MDIFEKSVEIWNKINDPILFTYEKRFVFDNEYVGKENNCLSSIATSVFILDGELNQLSIVKQKKNNLFCQTVLMTPQPLEKFTRMELSSSKLFIALIGADSVSLIDICSLTSSDKTCKKIKEIFTTKDTIIDVKWYPKLHDYLIILTKQSLHIFHIYSDLKYYCFYKFNLYEEINCKSKSFGIKEEYIGCDFGTVNFNTDDNTLFILKESGEVFLVPELRKLENNKNLTPTKLLFDPPSSDNYEDDFTSIIVLRGAIDVVVLANSHGSVQHALFINGKICVYEKVTFEVAINTSNQSEMILVPDETAYPPRYFLVHSTGIESCILPWVVRLRLAIRHDSERQLEETLHTAGATIFDHVLRSSLSDKTNVSRMKFAGITVIRRPNVSPELCVMQSRISKTLVKLALRSESSVMLEGRYSGEDTFISTRDDCVYRETASGKFMVAFQTELGKAKKLPMLSSGSEGLEISDSDRVSLVLMMNDIAGEYGSRLATAGKIFEHRLDQLAVIVGLQKDQLLTINFDVENLQVKSNNLKERYERAFSRQQNLFNRLSDCSHKIAEINGTAPRADRDASNMITDISKRLTSMKALLRSCKLRFSQSEDYIDEFKKEEKKISELSKPYNENIQMILSQEDAEISQLIADVRTLMKR